MEIRQVTPVYLSLIFFLILEKMAEFVCLPNIHS